MIIQLMSDLHFEFHLPDGGRNFVRSLNPNDIDVLVLAGDIAVAADLPRALKLFSRRFAKSQIVFVHGNHEFYTSDRQTVMALTRDAVAKLPNVHFLDCDAVTLFGRRFLGAPLWFSPSPECHLYRSGLSDYRMIKDYADWVHDENRRAVSFFETNLQERDIVVTHHLPCQASVADRFKNDPFNCFFVHDLEHMIRDRCPDLWMHGHTHESVQTFVHHTLIACNPYGYKSSDLNPKFKRRLTFSVENGQDYKPFASTEKAPP